MMPSEAGARISLAGLTAQDLEVLHADPAGTEPRLLRVRLGGWYVIEGVFEQGLLNLYHLRPKLRCRPTAERREPAAMTLEEESTSCLYLPRPLDATATTDDLVALFLESIDEAVGLRAEERCRLLRGAARIVCEKHGMTDANLHPATDRIIADAGRKQIPKLSTQSFDPKHFLSHVRESRDNGLEPVVTLPLGDCTMSAHERLSLIETLVPAFESYEIDIRAWWREMGVHV